MNSFHKAVNNTVEIDIVQSLSSDMQLSTYTNVSSVASGPYSQPMYYDGEGVKLTSSAGAVYTVTVQSSTDLSTTSLFGSPNSTLSANVGTAVLIAVSSASQPAVTNYFPMILANSHQ